MNEISGLRNSHPFATEFPKMLFGQERIFMEICMLMAGIGMLYTVIEVPIASTVLGLVCRGRSLSVSIDFHTLTVWLLVSFGARESKAVGGIRK